VWQISGWHHTDGKAGRFRRHIGCLRPAVLTDWTTESGNSWTVAAMDCVLSVTERLVSNVATLSSVPTYRFRTANKTIPPFCIFVSRDPWHPLRGTQFEKHCHRWYDIFVGCSWVATRWQQYSSHLHTNSKQNDTKQTKRGTTHKLATVRAVPHLCGFYPGICLTNEEKARKNLSQGSRRVLVGKMKIHTIRVHRHNSKNT
jgi:hypothetical protein